MKTLVRSFVMDTITIYFNAIKNSKTSKIQTEIVRSTKYLLTSIDFVVQCTGFYFGSFFTISFQNICYGCLTLSSMNIHARLHPL